MNPTLPKETRLGAVSLTIPSLERSIQFYRDQLGMQVLESVGSHARLGVDGATLLHLDENPDARRASGVTGLYHFAIRLPSRRDLARLLVQISNRNVSIEGFGDHGVSESLYLPDVDGNGIEIYSDRPQSEWPRNKDGNLRMGVDPVDIDDLLAELGETPPSWQGLPAGTDMGHVHLHVSELEATLKFYRDVLGFDLIQEYGQGALFLSAGGYHHHIGANTWAGIGAPPPPPNSIGLQWYEILLPDAAALQAVLQRLGEAGIAAQPLQDGWLVGDPSQNGIRLAAAG